MFVSCSSTQDPRNTYKIFNYIWPRYSFGLMSWLEYESGQTNWKLSTRCTRLWCSDVVLTTLKHLMYNLVPLTSKVKPTNKSFPSSSLQHLLVSRPGHKQCGPMTNVPTTETERSFRQDRTQWAEAASRQSIHHTLSFSTVLSRQACCCTMDQQRTCVNSWPKAIKVGIATAQDHQGWHNGHTLDAWENTWDVCIWEGSGLTAMPAHVAGLPAAFWVKWNCVLRALWFTTLSNRSKTITTCKCSRLQVWMKKHRKGDAGRSRRCCTWD